MFKRPLIYIQVHSGYFVAKRIGSDRSVRKHCTGLDHPRTLMGDFHVVEACFKVALNELCLDRRFVKPRVLVHLIPDTQGGYTNVELRAFKEASLMAGAASSSTSTHERPHTDSEIAALMS